MWRALILALALSACSPTPSSKTFNATDVSGASWGSDFRLADNDGKPRQLADYRGSAVVLFFGYTQCPDVCPMAMSKLHEVMSQLGDEAKRVQVVFVTLDPERDTPELLAQYVPAFDSRFIGLHGSIEATTTLAKEFKIFYQKQPGSKPGSYSIDHTAGLYVFDPKGRLRLFVRDGEESAKITADIRTLLAGN